MSEGHSQMIALWITSRPAILDYIAKKLNFTFWQSTLIQSDLKLLHGCVFSILLKDILTGHTAVDVHTVCLGD